MSDEHYEENRFSVRSKDLMYKYHLCYVYKICLESEDVCRDHSNIFTHSYHKAPVSAGKSRQNSGDVFVNMRQKCNNR